MIQIPGLSIIACISLFAQPLEFFYVHLESPEISFQLLLIPRSHVVGFQRIIPCLAVCG